MAAAHPRGELLRPPLQWSVEVGPAVQSWDGVSPEIVLLTMRYHGMQLREAPSAARLLADVQSAHAALVEASAEVDGADTDAPADPPPNAAAGSAQCGALDLSLNALSALPALPWPQHLCSLDLSLNHLTSLGAPGAADAPAPESYGRLSALLLGTNCLTSLGGIEAFGRLLSLDVSYNQLASLEGVEALGRLQTLSAEGNHILSLRPLSGLDQLESCTAHHNAIRSLAGLGAPVRLATLDVSYCELSELGEVAPACAALPALAHLCLHGNGLDETAYVPLLLGRLPRLRSLDELDANAPVRAHAQQLMAARAAEADAALPQRPAMRAS